VAAGDEEGLADDPARILGGKKDRDGADVVGLTDAAQRRLRFHGFLKVRSGDAGGMKAFRFDHAGFSEFTRIRQIPTVVDRRYNEDCKDRYGEAPKPGRRGGRSQTRDAFSRLAVSARPLIF
jgi:hypothetical protein